MQEPVALANIFKTTLGTMFAVKELHTDKSKQNKDNRVLISRKR